MIEYNMQYKDVFCDQITFITLVGVIIKEYPLEGGRGNCFGMLSKETGKDYKIVNFSYQNLKQLIKRGLTFPIHCLELNDKTAIIHDQRIDPLWYKTKWCEVCCPKELLPIPQQLAHKRSEAAGIQRIKKYSKSDETIMRTTISLSKNEPIPQTQFNIVIHDTTHKQYIDGLLCQCQQIIQYDKEKNLISNKFVKIEDSNEDQ